MRRIVVGMVGVLAVALASLSSVALAQPSGPAGDRSTRLAADPTLVVQNETGRELNPITIDLKAGIAAGKVVVNIHNAGKQAATFGLAATFPGATVTVTPAAGGSASTYRVKPGEEVAVAIEVAGVATPGTEKGHLSVIVGSNRSIADITVTRATGPDEVVVDGATTEGIVSSLFGSEFRKVLSLVPPDKEDGGVPIAVATTGLTGPDGQTYALTVTHNGKPIPSDERISKPHEVTLAADLPLAGPYTGTMTIMADGYRGTPVKVSVTRTPATLDLTVSQTSSPNGTVRLGRGGTTTLSLVVSSPSPVVLSTPTVHLVRGEGTTEDMKVRSAIKVHGEEIEDDGTIDLTAEEAVKVDIELSDIDEPGAYTATVEIRADGVKGTVEKAFKFGMKRSRPSFFIPLVLGLLLSALITWWVKRKGNALNAQAAAAPFLDQLDRLRPLASDPRDLGLVEYLVGRLEDKLDELDADTGSKVDAATFSEVSIRIKLLTRVINVGMRVKQAGPHAAAAVAAKLEVVRSFIEGLPDADQAPADAAINAAQGMIDEAREVREVLRTMKRLVEARKSMLDEAAGTALLTDLTAAIDEEDVSEAAPTADALEARAIELFATAVQDRADEITSPPGISNWPAVQSRLGQDATSIAEMTKLDVADAQLDLTFHWFLQELVAGLESVTDNVEIKDLLAAARVSLGRPGGLANAAASYNRAKKLYDDAQQAKREADAAKARAAREAELKRLKDAAIEEGGGDPDTVEIEELGEAADFAVAPGSFTFLFSGGAATQAEPTRASRMSKIADARRRLTWVSVVIASVVAIVVGYELLYASSAVWGSDPDISAAFLWGLGISASGTLGLAGVLSKTDLGGSTTE